MHACTRIPEYWRSNKHFQEELDSSIGEKARKPEPTSTNVDEARLASYNLIEANSIITYQRDMYGKREYCVYLIALNCFVTQWCELVVLYVGF